MARTVFCIKLKREADGLDLPPSPGGLGKRIFENVSKEAWADWLKHQTMLVNEYRLNLSDVRARKYLQTQMRRTSLAMAPRWPRASHRHPPVINACHPN